MKKGLIHIYCGDGKGKTTCGVGLCVRAAGAGRRVLIYQFMKDNSSSERRILEKIPNMKLEKGPDQMKFSFQMTGQEKEDYREACGKKLRELFQTAREEKYDVLFLDEAVYAVSAGLIDESRLLEELRKKPCGLEVILTGQDPDRELTEAADYVTYMKKIRHPYDRGITAREGIER